MHDARPALLGREGRACTSREERDSEQFGEHGDSFNLSRLRDYGIFFVHFIAALAVQLLSTRNYSSFAG
jgi:hypothetical protein